MPIFTEQDRSVTGELLSKYCKQKMADGKCFADKCDGCPVQAARQKIVNGVDDGSETTDEETAPAPDAFKGWPLRFEQKDGQPISGSARYVVTGNGLKYTLGEVFQSIPNYQEGFDPERTDVFVSLGPFHADVDVWHIHYGFINDKSRFVNSMHPVPQNVMGWTVTRIEAVSDNRQMAYYIDIEEPPRKALRFENRTANKYAVLTDGPITFSKLLELIPVERPNDTLDETTVSVSLGPITDRSDLEYKFMDGRPQVMKARKEVPPDIMDYECWRITATCDFGYTDYHVNISKKKE